MPKRYYKKLNEGSRPPKVSGSKSHELLTRELLLNFLLDAGESAAAQIIWEEAGYGLEFLATGKLRAPFSTSGTLPIPSPVSQMRMPRIPRQFM